MLNANEIRNARFSKAMGGYKQEEVDVLLDKVEADYEQFERTLRELNGKIEQLSSELEDAKNSQGNIQNILVSAQKFADQIVEEAKAKSADIIASAQENIEKITEQEKELTTAFDKKAGERKNAYKNDLDKIIADATKKQEKIEKATQDCVDRQQLLFNKMKTEVAEFKAEITARYKEHLELLSKIPDTVPNDPVETAKAVELAFDTMPTVEEYTENPEAFNLDNAQKENIEPNESTEPEEPNEPAEPEEPAERLIKSASTGFVINADGFELDDEE
ncbi:MAG: DivIVA domain-containing protein [Clostridia bacterium]|nr:DivIVA domain-containing protein [Clostridia bacterium]